MAYIQRSQISTYISESELPNFLDDDSDGSEDPGLLDAIISMASNKADSFVSSVFTTPFPVPPSKIVDATIIFSCFAIYARRLTPEEKNPFKAMQDFWEDLLSKVGAGVLPLDANIDKVIPPIIAITSPSILNDSLL